MFFGYTQKVQYSSNVLYPTARTFCESRLRYGTVPVTGNTRYGRVEIKQPMAQIVSLFFYFASSFALRMRIIQYMIYLLMEEEQFTPYYFLAYVRLVHIENSL